MKAALLLSAPVAAFLASAFLAPSSAMASLPDGLYTTIAPERGLPTPVGYNSFDRSGFTLVIGPGWRLSQPILPLDMSWLKPWLEGPGVIVRVKGLSDDTVASAAARLAKEQLGVLLTGPFQTDGGLAGVRIVWGLRGKNGSLSVWKAAYLFANRPGFVYAFIAEPWPRKSGQQLPWKIDKPSGVILPSDALLKSAALERERVGYRP